MTERKTIAGDFPRTLQPWASLVPWSLATGTPKPVVEELEEERENTANLSVLSPSSKMSVICDGKVGTLNDHISTRKTATV